jgi:hypothetical protein
MPRFLKIKGLERFFDVCGVFLRLQAQEQREGQAGRKK